MSDKIIITFPDGNKKDLKKGVSGFEIAESISKSLAKESIAIKINNEISEAEGEIKEKKETALAEISSISESLAIEMLESLSVGEIDKGKIAALSKTDN